MLGHDKPIQFAVVRPGVDSSQERVWTHSVFERDLWQVLESQAFFSVHPTILWLPWSAKHLFYRRLPRDMRSLFPASQKSHAVT